MPCRDYPSDDYVRGQSYAEAMFKRDLDQRTRHLCVVMRTLKRVELKAYKSLPKDILEWHKRHEAADAAAQRLATEERQRAMLKKLAKERALKKLTVADRKALGLK